MKYYRITLTPQSAFGTLLKGDTLFGQMCWAIANRYGEERLVELLADYSRNPFAVCSDGFPEGYLPRPSLPASYFSLPKGEDRKAVKKKCWILQENLERPLAQWLDDAKSGADLVGDNSEQQQPHNTINRLTGHIICTAGGFCSGQQPHNTINRLTGTTGEGMFAPYQLPQIWHKPCAQLDVYLLVDEARLPLAEIKIILNDIGAFGYGRDASIGLGKFECTNVAEWNFPSPKEEANACMTLSPCAPQGLGLDNARSFYRVFTRFGRHGDRGVHKQHGPFKAPVLLADTAAVFPLPLNNQCYIGQGLGGNGQLSKAIPATVHQGYAPCIPFHLSVQQQEAA